MNSESKEPAKALSCETCYYVMPSYSSSTGLRCGIKYFQASAFMRKLQRMEYYPEVKKINACESWLHKSA